jgi:hypothetical protein
MERKQITFNWSIYYRFKLPRILGEKLKKRNCNNYFNKQGKVWQANKSHKDDDDDDDDDDDEEERREEEKEERKKRKEERKKREEKEEERKEEEEREQD